MELISVKHLCFTYPNSSEPALNDLSLSVNEGDFVVLCGRSGCGKTTFIRQLKPAVAPHGTRTGEIFFSGTALDAIDERTLTSEIGFVHQSADNQIVTDKVWHELAFGLESLGLESQIIRRRVSEICTFFGIQDLIDSNVSELSGGQKQILNLASVMVMQPGLLLLDEPTSRLDPVAASAFLNMLHKINRELGTTIILTEHRFEDVFEMATLVAVMDCGRVLFSGGTEDACEYLRNSGNGMYIAMPAAMRIWASVESSAKCPVSVNEGRSFLNGYVSEHKVVKTEPAVQRNARGQACLKMSDVCFRYNTNGTDIIHNLSLTAYSGESLCLLGGNGVGKSTLLMLIAGLFKPRRGNIDVNGRVSLLPQEPQTLFVTDSVVGELYDVCSDKAHIEDICSKLALDRLLDRHPYDLSGGEQQRLAIAKLLLLSPNILLLDEPTKGMDAEYKQQFAHILRQLTSDGVCVIMVSHDIEFCAEYCDRCALFFNGSITAEGCSRDFFCGNSFYTTSANRIARDCLPCAVTVGDVITCIGGKADEKTDFVDTVRNYQPTEIKKPQINKKLPFWRKLCVIFCACCSLALFLYSASNTNVNGMIGETGLTALGVRQVILYSSIIVLLIMCAVFSAVGKGEPTFRQERSKLSKRSIVSIVTVLVFIPVTLYIGLELIDKKQFYITAFAIIIECMLPFFISFEGRHHRAHELVILAVICALGVAGRAAFYMIPQFKPVLALVIISGVAFGCESGFLVGAVTMFVSNMLFSQGPWTPWQMFAMGIIGFISGLIWGNGRMRAKRIPLCIFGALATIIIYGGIVNPVYLLIWGSGSVNLSMVIGTYIAGFPMDCIHAAATALFLWFAAEPFLEKFERVKLKYGI